MDTTTSRGSDEPTDSKCCKLTDMSVFLERIKKRFWKNGGSHIKSWNWRTNKGEFKLHIFIKITAAWLNKNNLIWGQLQSFSMRQSQISTLESATAHRKKKKRIIQSVIQSQGFTFCFYNDPVTLISSELVSPGQRLFFLFNLEVKLKFQNQIVTEQNRHKTENGVTFPPMDLGDGFAV